LPAVLKSGLDKGVQVNRITLTDGIVWPDGTYKHSSYGTDVELQFEIGNEFGEHGNKIEGGVSNGREGNREIISVNFKEDINLSKMFNRIRESIQSMYPQYDLTRLPGEIRGQLLKLIFDEISDKVKYKDMLPQHEAGNLILVGDTIETGGVCRHMGILAAAIIERFINEGVLGGRIYYVRGHGHGWAVYETSDGAYSYVLDVAQDVLKDLNGKTYFGGDGLYLYSEDYQRVKLLEREQAVAPDAAMMTQKNLPAHRTSVVVNFDKDTKAIIINDEKTEKKLSITLYRSKDGTYSVSYGYEGGERLFEVVPFDMFKTNDMSKMGVTILRRRDQFTIVNNRRRNLVITTDNAMRTPLVVRLADEAALANPLNPLGGIDFNSANLNLQIKRDGKGVPLPISQQDLEHINIDGLIPIIIDIRPATSLPIFSELQTTSSSVT
jgi:hypothetical protein